MVAASAIAGHENKLVYLAFGRVRYVHECLFSILKGLACCTRGMPQTIVFTDQPDEVTRVLGTLPWLELRELTSGQVQSYRSSSAATKAAGFRIKICLMMDLLREGLERAVMIDGDTYFLKCPWTLFEGIGERSLRMHLLEGPLNDGRPVWDNLRKGVTRYNETMHIAGEFPILPDQPVYNSGVIGLAKSHRADFSRALDVFDGLAGCGIDERIYEQVAISRVLSPLYRILPSDDILAHYWFDRGPINRVQQRLFSDATPRSLEEWVAAAKRIQPGRWWRTKIVRGVLSRPFFGMRISPHG